MRRVLKSELKREKAVKEATTAKDEVAAARAANESAKAKLKILEEAIRALSVQPKKDPIVTDEELEVLRKFRALRSGQ
eukprot:12330674-Heterocapsa_arctica.AAC.1